MLAGVEAILICGGAGCSRSSQPAVGGTTASALKPSKPASMSPMEAQAGGATFSLTDPVSGKILWSAVAQSLDAQTGTESGTAIGSLHNVSAIMYHDGDPADRMSAATVTADQSKRLVSASGGVEVNSIGAQPTSIRCDNLTWQIDSDTMLGAGNVVCTRGGFTQNAPSFQADTRMRQIVMPAPSIPGAPAGSIHATFAERHNAVQ